jgi:hypothetical protein
MTLWSINNLWSAQVPAGILRDVLRNNPSSLKDRLKIKLEPDNRHGTLYFDHYILQAKVSELGHVTLLYHIAFTNEFMSDIYFSSSISLVSLNPIRQLRTNTFTRQQTFVKC